MHAHHALVALLAFALSFIGCCLTDDLFTQVAMVAGAAGVAVVLADLQRHPHRPMQRAAEPSKELSP
jgi:hypothetical protein